MSVGSVGNHCGLALAAATRSVQVVPPFVPPSRDSAVAQRDQTAVDEAQHGVESQQAASQPVEQEQHDAQALNDQGSAAQNAAGAAASDATNAASAVDQDMSTIASDQNPVAADNSTLTQDQQTLENRPARGQHTHSELIVWEPLDLAQHERAEVVEVAQKNLGAGRRRAGRLRERQAHREQATSSSASRCRSFTGTTPGRSCRCAEVVVGEVSAPVGSGTARRASRCASGPPPWSILPSPVMARSWPGHAGASPAVPAAAQPTNAASKKPTSSCIARW